MNNCSYINTNTNVKIKTSPLKSKSLFSFAACAIFVCAFCSSSLAGGSPHQLKTYKKNELSKYSLVKEPNITYFGIIPKAIVTPKPLQLINPFAAKSYGYGRNMTSWNAREGKPKGFIVAGIRFW